MDQVILSPIPIDVLTSKIHQIITAALTAKQEADLKEKLLSRVETCEYFHITKPTLYKWTKDGRIQEYRMGGRVFYKYNEIMESLKTIKKYKK